MRETETNNTKRTKRHHDTSPGRQRRQHSRGNSKRTGKKELVGPDHRRRHSKEAHLCGRDTGCNTGSPKPNVANAGGHVKSGQRGKAEALALHPRRCETRNAQSVTPTEASERPEGTHQKKNQTGERKDRSGAALSPRRGRSVDGRLDRRRADQRNPHP